MLLYAKSTARSHRQIKLACAGVVYRPRVSTESVRGTRSFFLRRPWKRELAPEGAREIDVHGVHGSINQYPVFATTASESRNNLISEAFALQCGLDVRPARASSIHKIGNTFDVQAVGSATASWLFQNELAAHHFEFTVLSDIDHPVVLGYDSLEATETLSTNWHRLQVQELTLQSSPSFIFGEPSTSIAGSLEGVPVLALPATGTEINLVSTPFLLAHRLSRRVRKRREARSLRLPNGTFVQVDKSLILYWKFGDDREYSWPVEFGVVNDLPYDVVLGNEILFGAEAFQQYSDCTRKEPPTARKRVHGAVGVMPAIMLAFRRKPGSSQAVKFAGDHHIITELSRRASADHTILTLSEKERSAAYVAEQARRSNWNMCQRQHESGGKSFAEQTSASDHLAHFPTLGSQNHSMLAAHADHPGNDPNDSDYSDDSSSTSSGGIDHDAGWHDTYDSDHR